MNGNKKEAEACYSDSICLWPATIKEAATWNQEKVPNGELATLWVTERHYLGSISYQFVKIKFNLNLLHFFMIQCEKLIPATEFYQNCLHRRSSKPLSALSADCGPNTLVKEMVDSDVTSVLNFQLNFVCLYHSTGIICQSRYFATELSVTYNYVNTKMPYMTAMKQLLGAMEVGYWNMEVCCSQRNFTGNLLWWQSCRHGGELLYPQVFSKWSPSSEREARQVSVNWLSCMDFNHTRIMVITW